MEITKSTPKYKQNLFSTFKKCWAEIFFIELLNIGQFCLTLMLILLTGRLTGVLTQHGLNAGLNVQTAAFVLVSAAIYTLLSNISAPLAFGTRWFYWQLSGGKVMPISSIFAAYHSRDLLRRCIMLNINVSFRRCLSLMGVTLAAAAEIILYRQLVRIAEGNTAAIITIKAGMGIMLACSVILFTLICIRFIPVGYVMANDPDLTNKDIIALSRKIIKIHQYDLIYMYLSFYKWTLLCLLFFPILIIQPLFLLATANFLREAIDRMNTAEAADAQPEELRKDELLV